MNETEHLVDEEKEFQEAMKNAPEPPPPSPETMGKPEDYQKSTAISPEHQVIGRHLMTKVRNLLQREDVTIKQYLIDDQNQMSRRSREVITLMIGEDYMIDIKIDHFK